MDLSVFDLRTNDGVTMIRNRALRPARVANNLAEVERVLQHISLHRPDRILEMVERIDILMENGRPEAALEILDTFYAQNTLVTKDLELTDGYALLRVNLNLGRNDEAAQIAENLGPEARADPRTMLLMMRAFFRSGRREHFIEVAKALFPMDSVSPDWQIEILHALNATNASATALALFETFEKGLAESPDLLLQVARAHLQARQTDESSIRILERAHSIAPDRDDIRIMLSRAFLQLGKTSRALEILDLVEHGPIQGTESTLAHAAEVLSAAGEHQRASEIFAELSRMNPCHGGWKRSLIGALLNSNQGAKAEAIYQEDRLRRQRPMNRTFLDELQALEENLDLGSVPEARFEWAYRKLATLDAAPENLEAWKKACLRNQQADLLTLDWLETRTDDVDQLISLIDYEEDSLQLLLESQANGRGAFIAGAHVGAMFSGPAFLAARDLKFKWIASTPPIASIPGAENLLSTLASNRLGLARSVLAAIRSGEIVSLAVDGAAPSNSRVVDFADNSILLTDFVPRIVHQTNAQSFFPKIFWQGDRIHAELVELIPPDPDDTIESFMDVWFEDYIECLAEFFIDAPDNLRLSGGFWTKIST